MEGLIDAGIGLDGWTDDGARDKRMEKHEWQRGTRRCGSAGRRKDVIYRRLVRNGRVTR